MPKYIKAKKEQIEYGDTLFVLLDPITYHFEPVTILASINNDIYHVEYLNIDAEDTDFPLSELWKEDVLIVD
jgi:hypothetical protein